MKTLRNGTVEVCLLALMSLTSASSAMADSITLIWDANPDRVAGYWLYVGVQPATYTQKFNTGSATTFTFTGATPGQRYCFAVSAYTTSVEGPKSADVCGFSDAPPLLTNPGSQSSIVGQPVSLQLDGSDPDGQPLTYYANGLPPGLALMPSTGFISGVGTTTGTYSVTAVASDGVLSSSSQSFTWTLSAPQTVPAESPSVTLTAQVIDNSGNDQVRLTWTTAPWSATWIFRDGAFIVGTSNDGTFMDQIFKVGGTYTYRICAPNATMCSNTATVVLRSSWSGQ